MLPNLPVILIFLCLIIENFKKVFMRHLAIGSIVVYRTTIISNILNKVANCIEFKIVKGWLTYLGVDWPVILKFYLYFF